MSKKERLVQARVPEDVYARLVERANKAGFRTIAAYLRSCLMRQDQMEAQTPS